MGPWVEMDLGPSCTARGFGQPRGDSPPVEGGGALSQRLRAKQTLACRLAGL